MKLLSAALRCRKHCTTGIVLASCLVPTSVWAATHTGLTNPLTEGWVVASGDTGTATQVISDPDFPSVTAWQINLAAGLRLRYEVDGPAPSESWTFRARIRIVDPNADYTTLDHLIEIANQGKRFMLTLGSDNGDTEISPIQQSEVDSGITNPPEIVVPRANPAESHTDYVNLAIAYSADEGSADIFVNGVEVFSDYAGLDDPSNLDRVNFGDGQGGSDAGSNQRYAMVSYSTGAQACRDGIDNDGDGKVDFAGGDEDCSSPNDPTESTYCALGEDIDHDGYCEQVIGRHIGAGNPTTVGWTAAFSNVTSLGDVESGAAGCAAPCGYREINDSITTVPSTGTYSFPIAAAQYNDPLGWVLRGRLRIVPFTSGLAENVDLASTMYMRIAQGINKEYFTQFGLTADNHLLVKNELTGTSADVGLSNDYHSFEMVYDPDRNAVDVVVDGKLLYANYTGASFTTQNAVYWGSGQSSARKRTLFHEVSFETAPDTDNDGIPDMAERRAANATDPYDSDSDDDDLPDLAELSAGTNPNDVDSDGDGLGDGFEVYFGFNPLLADADVDAEPDGLTNRQEQLAGTDPTSADTDGDGLSDGDEVNGYGTDPTSVDSDGDGLADNVEIFMYQTDPTRADADNDGLNDREELEIYGTNVFVNDSDGDGALDGQEVFTDHTDPLDPDSDDDGLRDGFESRYAGLDPTQPDDTSVDTDGDGLDYLAEQAAGSNPNSTDSDGDGLDDDVEVAAGTNPGSGDSDNDGLSDSFELQYGLLPRVAGDAALDGDSDGLSNLEEQFAGTDPTNSDTDGDGVVDGQEINIAHTDPLRSDAGAVAQTAATNLTYVSTNQPLFTLDPPEVRIDLLTQEEKDKLNQSVAVGEVYQVQGQVPLSSWQAAWDRGLAQCTSERLVANVLPSFCKTAGKADSTGGDFYVTPTTNECLSGVANIASRSLSCCIDQLGLPDYNDDISNGCTGNILGAPNYGTFTIAEANASPINAGIPTTYDTGLAFPPRPTVAPPPGNYTVGAQVNVSTNVTADLVLTAESMDPGSLDVTYSTKATLTADSSSVAEGDVFRLSATHAPSASDSSMTSTWAPIGLSMFYEINATPNASGTFYGFNPYKSASYYNGNGYPDFQDQTTFNLFNGAQPFNQTGELMGLTAAASDRVEFRFMNDFIGAPEVFKNTVFSIDAGIIDFDNPDVGLNIPDLSPNDIIPPGTALPISVPNVFLGKLDECPFKFLSPAAQGFCLGVTGPGGIKNFFKNFFKTKVSQEMFNLRLQLPEVNTPVSAEFNGGRLYNVFDAPNPAALSQKVKPKRNAIAKDGSLVNTVPNGNRPLENYTGNSAYEALFTDQTNLSSDTVRFQWDLDGTFSSPGNLGLFDKTIGNPFVGVTFGLLDFDVTLWTGIDQALEFKPNLTARISFDKDVLIRLCHADLPECNETGPPFTNPAFALLPTGSTATLPARALGGGDDEVWLEILQPAGGVNVQASYSFDDNVFANTTKRKITLAPEITVAKLGLTGLAGGALSAAGAPNAFAATKLVPASIPVSEVDLSDNRSVDSGGNPNLVRHLTGSITTNLGSSTLSIIERALDADADGLPDALEAASCTSQLDADSDDDGLGDGIEDANRNGIVDSGETNPCVADSDNDGLGDGLERGVVNPVLDPDGVGPAAGTNLALFVPDPSPVSRTDPLSADTDGDGVGDGEDAFPNDPAETTDTDGDGIGNNADADDDGDGMPDDYETANELDPLNAADAQADADGDGFTNLKEYQAGTNPQDASDHPLVTISGALLLLLGD